MAYLSPKVCSQFDSLTAQQQDQHANQDSPALLIEPQLRLPLGLRNVRYMDLGEALPFFDYQRNWRPIRVRLVHEFLGLPSLKFPRFTHNFERSEFGDLQHIFEWEPSNGILRESQQCIHRRRRSHWKFWSIRELETATGDCIVSYECSTATAQKVQALHLHSAQNLDSRTFTKDTPNDLAWLLIGFSNLKTLTVGVKT